MEGKPAPLSLAIHGAVEEMQNVNGIKRKDFYNYRMYCTRRLKRVREILGFKQGRNRFNRKPFPSTLDNPKYLLLLVVAAERAWASALELKTQNALRPVADRRVKLHIVSRLKKAAKYSEDLFELCKDVADSRTTMEAKAYSSWVRGLWEMERGLAAEAYKSFENSHKVYIHLVRTDHAQQHLFTSKLEQLESSARASQYELKKAGIPYEEWQSNGPTKAAVPVQTTEEAITAVRWHGLQMVSFVEETKAKLQNCIDLRKSSCLGPKIIRQPPPEFFAKVADSTIAESYSDVVGEFQELLALAQDELLQAGDSAQEGLHALQGFALEATRVLPVERDLIFFLNFLWKLELKDGSFNTKANWFSGIRQSDLILQGLKKFATEEGETLKISQEAVNDARIVVLACHFGANQKHYEGLALMDSLPERQLPKKAEREWETIFELSRLLQTLTKRALNQFYPLCIANALEHEYGATAGKAHDLQNLLDKCIESEDFPPKHPVLPCKPMLFDMASQEFDPPQLGDRTKGLVGRLTSWWRR